MSLQITAAERDALYDEIFVRLSGIDYVWVAVEQEDYETADRLAREFSDNLRLVFEDLGWGEGGGEPLELKTPADVLHRILTRLQGTAEYQQAEQARERAERRRDEEQTQRLMDVCRRVLEELEGEQGSPW